MYISLKCFFLLTVMSPLFIENCIYKNRNKVGESIGHAEGNLRNAVSPLPACLEAPNCCLYTVTSEKLPSQVQPFCLSFSSREQSILVAFFSSLKQHGGIDTCSKLINVLQLKMRLKKK